MKTAEQWLNAVGEAVGQDMFCNPGKPGSRSEDIIKAIQSDALRWALTEAEAKIDWPTIPYLRTLNDKIKELSPTPSVPAPDASETTTDSPVDPGAVGS